MRVTIIEPKIKEFKKLRVCAYARVSTNDEKQGDSLENQVAYYERLISANPEYDLVGIFADNGITGTKLNRPEFQKMFSEARAGNIDLIITKSISRFARNTVITLQTVRELKNLNVEVYFEKENIRTLSGDGELMLTVLSSFAEEESRAVSENVKWRFKKKFENGEVILTTSRFLGYDFNEKGQLVINKKEAKVVRRIFDEYLLGRGSLKISKILNAEGIKTVTGSEWHESTVRTILKNEKYKGDVLLQKTFTENHISKKKIVNRGDVDSYYLEGNHEAIISREDWDHVQDLFRKRAADREIVKGDPKYKNKYPLTSMLYCSKCGKALRRRILNSNLACRRVVWQCSTYIEKGCKACSGIKIDDSIVSSLKIVAPIIVKEEIRNGKKHYSYSSKDK